MVIVVTAFCGCVPDGKLKLPFDMQPGEIGDGWEITTPAAAGFDEARLQDAYRHFFSEDEYVTAISLLVIRGGRLVAEGYCRDPEDRYVPEAIQSATKSVTALILGMARDGGAIGSIDDPLYAYVPEAFDDDPRKRMITLRHLLTMRSGIDFSNDDFSLVMAGDRPRNALRHILSKPLFADPGARFLYRDCDPHLISGAVQAATGRTLEEIAREHLFDPLEIVTYVWEKDGDGRSFGPFGLYLRPRDLGKIGQLILGQGVWDGARLVSREWVEQMTSFQTEVDPDDPNTRGFTYGYYWWIAPEVGAVTALGHGGNYAFVVPGKDLVIVFTAEPDTDGDTLDIKLREFLPLAREIIEAIRD